MIKSGLVSITFRQLTPENIIKLVKDAGLDGIEWGGDIHVPHGDITKAKEVYKLSNTAGLNIPSYGSYYKVGKSEQEGLRFQDVLASAVELQTDVIRVWAGAQGSANADKDYWKCIIDDSRRIAKLAKVENIKIAYEYHSNTLTDTNESAKHLLDSVDHENIFSFWQPDVNKDIEYNKIGLAQSVESKLQHLHVYNWKKEGDCLIRKPLKDGMDEWVEYFKIADRVPGTHYAMLEFVENNLPDNFFRDAVALKHIIHKMATASHS